MKLAITHAYFVQGLQFTVLARVSRSAKEPNKGDVIFIIGSDGRLKSNAQGELDRSCGVFHGI